MRARSLLGGAVAAGVLMSLTGCDDLGTAGVAYVTTAGAHLVPGDVDNDGDIDLLTNVDHDTIDVLLNNGAGGFEFTQWPNGGGAPYGFPASLADVTGDGYDDLLLTLQEPSSTWSGGRQQRHVLFVNTTTGGFGPATTVLLDDTCGYCGPPGSAKFADMNGDGHTDVLTLRRNNKVATQFGDGTGSFGTPIETPLTGLESFNRFTFGDLDNDGDLDVVVGGTTNNMRPGRFEVLWGDGSGAFPAASFYDWSAGDQPSGTIQGIHLGDFDGNGALDILGNNFANNELSTASLLLGDGTGGFAPAVSRIIPPGQRYVLASGVADVDGDGFDDLVTGDKHKDADGNWVVDAWVLFGGPGDQQFTDGHRLAASGSAAAADLDGDSKPDLAFDDDGANRVTVFLNRWNGRP